MVEGTAAPPVSAKSGETMIGRIADYELLEKIPAPEPLPKPGKLPAPNAPAPPKEPKPNAPSGR